MSSNQMNKIERIDLQGKRKAAKIGGKKNGDGCIERRSESQWGLRMSLEDKRKPALCRFFT
jgi:hypothetical protein